MILSCFCGGCLTCAMHQEALALLARTRSGQGCGAHCTRRRIGGESSWARRLRGAGGRILSQLPRVFHVVRAIRVRRVREESDVWPRGTVARRRLGKARRLRESC